LDKDLTFHFPTEETKNKYKKVLGDLFEKAKGADEREFVIANLYFEGLMQVSDAYDVKKEPDGTIKDFQRLSRRLKIFARCTRVNPPTNSISRKSCSKDS